MGKKPYAYALSVSSPGDEDNHSLFSGTYELEFDSRPVRVLLVCLLVSLAFSFISFYLIATNHGLRQECQLITVKMTDWPSPSYQETETTPSVVQELTTQEPDSWTSTPGNSGLLPPRTHPPANSPKPKYMISSNKLNWFEALQDCTARGLKLLSIESRTEQDSISLVISQVAADEDFWTSGTNLFSSDTSTFHWASTGQRMNFTFWHAGTPNAPDSQHCVELTRDIDAPYKGQLRWNDYGCHIRSRFICEETDEDD